MDRAHEPESTFPLPNRSQIHKQKVSEGHAWGKAQQKAEKHPALYLLELENRSVNAGLNVMHSWLEREGETLHFKA